MLINEERPRQKAAAEYEQEKISKRKRSEEKYFCVISNPRSTRWYQSTVETTEISSCVRPETRFSANEIFLLFISQDDCLYKS